ncbi:PAP2 superfamily protein [Filimonas lacunae]|uniref:PAP2 superfamily protein n=1 Tax=Filimonas lacunae TaxID=477680 RepID=A0A173MCT7_9BACT|nr:phosphatase PAP2 family protein [Filimonas lacunae]BAV05337.1 PAP2 superfamily protein [Filimonas lacunae]SIT21905.1 PAP2 superfamily protein [Filimonas lacunae]
MIRSFITGLAFLTATLPATLNAQSAIVPDSGKTHFAIKPTLLVPMAMVGYGFAALHTPVFKNWNTDVHGRLANMNIEQHIHVDNYLQWTPAAAVYALNLAGIKGRNNFTNRTFLFGIATLIQGATIHSLKRMTQETRPDYSNKLSFPSGHTATAFASAEFMRMEYKDVSPWYGIAGYAVAATTGYLRMYNNKHWLSDVVTGAGIGILSTQASYFLYPKVVKLLQKKQTVSPYINDPAAMAMN